MALNIKCIVVGEIQENAYVYWDAESLEGVLIDPGFNAKKIISFVEAQNITLKAILLTHGHYDHTSACEELRSHFKIDVYSGFDEVELVRSAKQNGSSNMFGKEFSLDVDKTFSDGEKFAIANNTLKVLFTPGHTVGGVCYYDENEKILFSGDTLFFKSVGRTDFPTGNIKTLNKSITDVLFKLPDDVKVYPGHMQATTIGYEKKYNPFVHA